MSPTPGAARISSCRDGRAENKEFWPTLPQSGKRTLMLPFALALGLRCCRATRMGVLNPGIPNLEALGVEGLGV